MRNKIILGVTIFIITMSGIFFWLKSKMNNIIEDTKNSVALSQNIKTLFDKSSDLNKFPFQPKKIEWNNKYLVLESGGNANFNVMYKTDINKLLGTDNNFPGDNIKGLIVLNNGSLVKGIYEGTSLKAEQLFYELNYFDNESKTIIKKDTVYGPLPKEYIRTTERKGYTGYPENEQIVAKIKQALE